MNIFSAQKHMVMTRFRIALGNILLGILFFGGAVSTFASELTEVIACETAMITAVSTAETNYQREYTNFLNVQSSLSEMKAKSLPAYINTYQCDLKRVCAAVEYPSAESLLGTMDLCVDMSSEAFEKKFSVDFSSCTAVGHASRLQVLSRCKAFVGYKESLSYSVASSEFLQVSAVENQSFLSQKIFDIQKKMKILFEKTQLFARDFNKIVDDINCTIPDASHS